MNWLESIKEAIDYILQQSKQQISTQSRAYDVACGRRFFERKLLLFAER